MPSRARIDEDDIEDDPPGKYLLVNDDDRDSLHVNAVIEVGPHMDGDV
jgi:hypothetical protein